MEGWHEAACSAAFWSEGPDPASSRDTWFSSAKDFAASTALIDEAVTEPPSCSAKTKVLSCVDHTSEKRKNSCRNSYEFTTPIRRKGKEVLKSCPKFGSH